MSNQNCELETKQFLIPNGNHMLSWKSSNIEVSDTQELKPVFTLFTHLFIYSFLPLSLLTLLYRMHNHKGHIGKHNVRKARISVFSVLLTLCSLW